MFIQSVIKNIPNFWKFIFTHQGGVTFRNPLVCRCRCHLKWSFKDPGRKADVGGELFDELFNVGSMCKRGNRRFMVEFNVNCCCLAAPHRMSNVKLSFRFVRLIYPQKPEAQKSRNQSINLVLLHFVVTCASVW